MTGLIWLIQLIHYPAYTYIDLQKFVKYQQFHTRTITFIVGPMMIVELFTGLYFLVEQRANLLSATNFIGLILIWLATAFLSVPSHNKLNLGFDAIAYQSLVKTSWIRTGLWSLRSILLMFILLQILAPSH